MVNAMFPQISDQSWLLLQAIITLVQLNAMLASSALVATVMVNAMFPQILDQSFTASCILQDDLVLLEGHILWTPARQLNPKQPLTVLPQNSWPR